MASVTGLLLECDNCGDDEFKVYYDEDASLYRLECVTCRWEHHVRAN